MNIKSQTEKYIGIVILIVLVGAFIPTILTTLTNFSALDVPLAGLFDPSNGIVLLVLMAGVIYSVVKMVQSGK